MTQSLECAAEGRRLATQWREGKIRQVDVTSHGPVTAQINTDTNSLQCLLGIDHYVVHRCRVRAKHRGEILSRRQTDGGVDVVGCTQQSAGRSLPVPQSERTCRCRDGLVDVDMPHG